MTPKLEEIDDMIKRIREFSLDDEDLSDFEEDDEWYLYDKDEGEENN